MPLTSYVPAGGYAESLLSANGVTYANSSTGAVYAWICTKPAVAYALVALAVGDGQRLWSYAGGLVTAACSAAADTVYVAWSPSRSATMAALGANRDALDGLRAPSGGTSPNPGLTRPASSCSRTAWPTSGRLIVSCRRCGRTTASNSATWQRQVHQTNGVASVATSPDVTRP